MTYTPIPPGTLNWDVPVNSQFTQDDTRLNSVDGTLSFINAVLIQMGINITALQKNVPGPTDQGLKTWSFDPMAAISTLTPTTGQLLLARVPVIANISPVFCYYHVGTGGTGLTAGQNFLALYDSAGTRVAVSTDQTTNFGTSGVKVAGLSASLTPGNYWVAFLANGTSAPTLRGVSSTGGVGNTGTGASTSRFGTIGAAQTVTPTSFSTSSIAADIRSIWVALA